MHPRDSGAAQPSDINQASLPTSVDPSTQPTETRGPGALDTGALTTAWLPKKRLRQQLVRILAGWQETDVPAMHDILQMVWCGERMLQPTPEVGAVYDSETSHHALGIICASPRPAVGCIWIHHIATHPALLRGDVLWATAIRHLIDLAIDASLEVGYRGWVGITSEDADSAEWSRFGFHLHEDGTWRRMGYHEAPPATHLSYRFH